MKIYLDACCLSRLTDDQTQSRVRWEAEAVERIFQSIQHRLAIWVSSEALLDEILHNPIPKRRAEAQALFKFSSEIYQIDVATSDRARQLEAAGYGSYDALHLAIAESANVDALLSTDDRFVRKVLRRLGKPLSGFKIPYPG